MTTQSAPPTQGAMTVPKWASAHGMTRNLAYTGIHDGTIPHFKVGKYLRFRVSEVTAWLETLRRGGDSNSAVGRTHSLGGMS